MKHSLKIFSFLTAVALMFSACDKEEKYDVLANSKTGTAPTLSATTSTIAPAPTDSNNVVVTYSWTDPLYATDSAHQKYVVEIDTAGGNFENAARKTVIGNLSADFKAKELNAILLSYGFPFNVAKSMIVRVTSSYANNNEQYHSNVLTATMTPYKVPPKIPVPPALYVVGDLNGWNNSGGLDKIYGLSKIDETTYAGLINFTSPGNYKLIQELGNWGTQFHMISGGTTLGGTFEQKDADPGFPTPSDGWYKVTVDFQNGTYNLVKSDVARVEAPANLYLVGAVNGWNNSPSLDPKYKFTKVDDYVYTLTVDFTGSDGFKLIQELGNWGSQFHKVSGTETAGTFEQKDADPAFAPAGAGTYKITVNFATNTYTIVKQ